MIHVSRSGDGGGGGRSIAGESLRSHHQPSRRQVRLLHHKSSKVDFYAADSPAGGVHSRPSFHRQSSTRRQQKTMAADEVVDSQNDLENQEKHSKRDTQKLLRSLWKYVKEAWTGVISGTGTL